MILSEDNIDKLKSYFNSSGIDDREIENGIVLTKVGYAKIAKKFDITETDAINLVSDLVDHLKRKSGLEESFNSLLEDDEEDFDSEINSKYGTYNFIWSYLDDGGTGTARFSDKGVKIISIRDYTNQPITDNMDKDFIASIEKQAIDFIEKA